jgi:type II secretory pathway pseudopilin PulG
MRRVLHARPGDDGGEAGLTLIELLVATTMSIVLVGAAGSMVISAMRSQPEVSSRANSISSARWVLERLTREIRDGVKVDNATASSISFQTYVRHTTCGGTTPLASTSPSIKCEVTYTCTTTACSRTETAPEVLTGGTPRTIFSGIDSSNVFSYSPSAAAATYVRLTLRIPNPSGGSALTVSDGASLRNATLAN